MIGLISAIEVALLIIMLTGSLIILRFRDKFLSSYPKLRRFYDFVLLFMITFVAVEIVNIDYLLFKHLTQMLNEFISSLLMLMGSVFFVMGYVGLVHSLITGYKAIPLVIEFKGENVSTTVSPGVYFYSNLEEAYYTFLNLLRSSYAGLVVSRKHPEVIRKNLNITKIPVLWITKVDSDMSIYPTRLPYFLHILVEFINKGDREKVILIDGFEYLVIENGFNSVFRFLTTLNDHALLNNSVVIVPISKNVHTEKEISLLKREFNII